MKLAYRLLLILGHTLGDFALPLLQRLCQREGTTFDAMTPDQADAILPSLERVLEAYVLTPRDLGGIMHELRVEVGNERFAVSGRWLPSASAARLVARPNDQPEGG
jgi:hypothetical protein